MIRLGSLWYSCIYWSRFETLSAGYKSSAISHLVIIRLVCTKANSCSNFVMPSHLQLTCVKFSVPAMHHLLKMPKVTSPLWLVLLPLNQLSHHLLLVCPSVAKSICTFPRPCTRATQWIVLAFLDTLRRSTSEPSQYFEKLSLPCFTVTSHHIYILPFLRLLGQFLPIPKYPVHCTWPLHFWHHLLTKNTWLNLVATTGLVAVTNTHPNSPW